MNKSKLADNVNVKLRAAFYLFVAGIVGICTLYFIDIPQEGLPAEVLASFSPDQIKLLSMLQPLILLTLATVLGTLCYESTPLRLPLFRGLARRNLSKVNWSDFWKFGIPIGLLTGVVLVALSQVSALFIGPEMEMLAEQKVPFITRAGYGGLTEEILLRYGLMTTLVWIILKVSKQNELSVWLGILMSSVVFALGHLPLAYSLVEAPSTTLIGYILIGNSLGGIAYGWLYWKKGLETAMLAHICTHVVMLLAITGCKASSGRWNMKTQRVLSSTNSLHEKATTSYCPLIDHFIRHYVLLRT